MNKRIYDPEISAVRISKRRKELGLTQKELSKLANISIPTIKSYEGAKRVPQDDMLESLAKHLNVYEKWIVGEIDEKNFEDVINKFGAEASFIFRDEINLMESFIDFADSLGYSIDMNDKNVQISGQDSKKVLSYEDFNSFYKRIVDSIRDDFLSVKSTDKAKLSTPKKAYVSLTKRGNKKKTSEPSDSNDFRIMYKKYREKKEGDSDE